MSLFCAIRRSRRPSRRGRHVAVGGDAPSTIAAPIPKLASMTTSPRSPVTGFAVKPSPRSPRGPSPGPPRPCAPTRGDAVGGPVGDRLAAPRDAHRPDHSSRRPDPRSSTSVLPPRSWRRGGPPRWPSCGRHRSCRLRRPPSSARGLEDLLPRGREPRVHDRRWRAEQREARSAGGRLEDRRQRGPRRSSRTKRGPREIKPQTREGLGSRRRPARPGSRPCPLRRRSRPRARPRGAGRSPSSVSREAMAAQRGGQGAVLASAKGPEAHGGAGRR